mgnify:CR=1 FL=1
MMFSPAFVLACAIAHEIGHLLLPGRVAARPLGAGLMRPCWDRDDFRRADMGQLRFLPEAGRPDSRPRARVTQRRR